MQSQLFFFFLLAEQQLKTTTQKSVSIVIYYIWVKSHSNPFSLRSMRPIILLNTKFQDQKPTTTTIAHKPIRLIYIAADEIQREKPLDILKKKKKNLHQTDDKPKIKAKEKNVCAENIQR